MFKIFAFLHEILGKNIITSVFIKGYKSVQVSVICVKNVCLLLNLLLVFGIIPTRRAPAKDIPGQALRQAQGRPAESPSTPAKDIPGQAGGSGVVQGSSPRGNGRWVPG
jgi:hypothetical protein